MMLADRWSCCRRCRGNRGRARPRRRRPYFIDADATLRQADWAFPVGGLTVITFHNNHLVYAITGTALP